MLDTLNNSVDSFRQTCQKNVINPILELSNEIHKSLENISTQNSIIDLYDEIKDLDEKNPLKVERVLLQEEKDVFGSSVYRNISVKDIPFQSKPFFEQYIRYIEKNSTLFSIQKDTPSVLIEYSYEGEKDKIFQAYGINPMSRKYHNKKLKKSMYLTFDLIDNVLGVDKDILNHMNTEIGNWEEFSKYLGALKPGEKPEKPDWMSDEQWAEIYAITLKEVYEEQEEFNRSMVQKIPEEIAEMYFEKMRKEKLEEQKAQSSNIITIEGKDVSNEENTGDDDSYSL